MATKPKIIRHGKDPLNGVAEAGEPIGPKTRGPYVPGTLPGLSASGVIAGSGAVGASLGYTPAVWAEPVDTSWQWYAGVNKVGARSDPNYSPPAKYVGLPVQVVEVARLASGQNVSYSNVIVVTP